MTSAALHHDVLLPQSPGGNGLGVLLSVLAHVALLLALTTAVDWRLQTPETVSAELWASVPQAAAPRAEPEPEPVKAPAPTPAPPSPAPPPVAPIRAAPGEPDIAVERESLRTAEADAKNAAETEASQAEKADRRKAEADKRQADAEARKKAEADERRAAAEQPPQKVAAPKTDDARLDRLREEDLKRIMGQAGSVTGSGGTGAATQSVAPSAAYAGFLVAQIRRLIFFDTSTLPDSAVPEVEVRTAPGGTILSRRLVKSSEHREWDEAVLRAIDRIATLPRDVDGRVPPVILVAFRPRD